MNLVKSVTDQDEIKYNQPCAYGCLCDGHAVYCENDTWKDSPWKCRRTWYTGGETRDEDCEGFKQNNQNRQMKPEEIPQIIKNMLDTLADVVDRVSRLEEYIEPIPTKELKPDEPKDVNIVLDGESVKEFLDHTQGQLKPDEPKRLECWAIDHGLMATKFFLSEFDAIPYGAKFDKKPVHLVEPPTEQEVTEKLIIALSKLSWAANPEALTVTMQVIREMGMTKEEEQ